jgi:hypothetical protein
VKVTDSQRWLCIGLLALIALILVLDSFHFGSRPFAPYGVPSLVEFGEPGEEWGIYEAEDHGEAIGKGIVLPIILLAAGGFIYLGMRGKISN